MRTVQPIAAADVVWLCQAVAAIWYDDFETARRICKRGSGSSVFGIIRRTGNLPNGFICNVDGRRCVAFGGTQKTKQFIYQTASYAGLFDNQFNTVVLSTYWEAATQMWNILRKSGVLLPDSMTFFGHSYGAAIAELVSAIHQLQNPGCQVRCATIGEPRTHGPGLERVVSWRAKTRYQCEGDFVPCLPPLSYDLPNLFNPAPAIVQIQWQKLQHETCAIVLGAAGRTDTEPYSTGTRPVKVGDVLAWSIGHPTEYGAQHDAAVYAGRIFESAFRGGTAKWEDVPILPVGWKPSSTPEG